MFEKNLSLPKEDLNCILPGEAGGNGEKMTLREVKVNQYILFFLAIR